MSAAALFWIGAALLVIAIVGLLLAVAADLGDDIAQRALRQERAARAHSTSSPLHPSDGADAPRVPLFSPARGATTSTTKRRDAA